MARFSIEPRGPFVLAQANRYFGGWPTLSSDPNALVMAFPVEGWQTSAAVVVRQERPGVVTGEVIGAERTDAESAWKTALAAVSLDHDGTGFAEVGQRDPVIGQLQGHFGLMRPVCFHSPYEAAAALVIGHRLSIAQTRSLRTRLATEHGDAVTVGAMVLLHMWLRREGGPSFQRPGRQSRARVGS